MKHTIVTNRLRTQLNILILEYMYMYIRIKEGYKNYYSRELIVVELVFGQYLNIANSVSLLQLSEEVVFRKSIIGFNPLGFFYNNFELAENNLGQAHDTPLSHKQSFCEEGSSHFLHQKDIDRTKL